MTLLILIAVAGIAAFAVLLGMAIKAGSAAAQCGDLDGPEDDEEDREEDEDEEDGT